MMHVDGRAGEMSEFENTDTISTRPNGQRTEDYVTCRFG
jgi:ABC-type phosphate transport system ATPase subunit